VRRILLQKGPQGWHASRDAVPERVGRLPGQSGQTEQGQQGQGQANARSTPALGPLGLDQE
jgi:hypothetical protein